jgi:hypothetical protein
MEFRCPNCNAPIYSRKNKICGMCEKPLPKELLLTDEQTAFLKKQSDQEEKRSKEFNPNIVHGSGDGISGMI